MNAERRLSACVPQPRRNPSDRRCCCTLHLRPIPLSLQRIHLDQAHWTHMQTLCCWIERSNAPTSDSLLWRSIFAGRSVITQMTGFGRAATGKSTGMGPEGRCGTGGGADRRDGMVPFEDRPRRLSRPELRGGHANQAQSRLRLPQPWRNSCGMQSFHLLFNRVWRFSRI